MNEEEIQKQFKVIDEMSQEDLARLWRFAPSGHHYFDSTLPFYERFKKRFDELGGMTPSISKKIGFEP